MFDALSHSADKAAHQNAEQGVRVQATLGMNVQVTTKTEVVRMLLQVFKVSPWTIYHHPLHWSSHDIAPR